MITYSIADDDVNRKLSLMICGGINILFNIIRHSLAIERHKMVELEEVDLILVNTTPPAPLLHLITTAITWYKTPSLSKSELVTSPIRTRFMPRVPRL